jgi:hypothetical protein
MLMDRVTPKKLVLGEKFPTIDTRNTRFAATLISLHFSVFCKITEISYSPGLVGYSI